MKGENHVSRVVMPIVITFLLLAPLSVFADETISFKGIKFGMQADEISKLAGGNTEHGCSTAIKNETSFSLYGGNQPWTYGGIDQWSARCMESYDEDRRVPGITGLIEISAIVHSHNDGLAKFAGINTYSVDELVEIFSKVFGKFNIEKKVVKNGLGQEFTKKDATAIHGGAVMNIADAMSGENHQDYIHLKIVNLNYLTKKKALEDKKAADKLKDAKSDF